MSQGHYIRTPEIRKRCSESHLGLQSGEKHPLYGKHHTEETKQKMSESNKGKTPWMKGKTSPFKGVPRSEEIRRKIGDAQKGKSKSEDHKIKISNSTSGQRNHNWKGGKSFEPYCPKFTKLFKDRVRKFFKYTCQKCGHVWQPGEEKLSVHHVNYDKMVCCNGVRPLFVPLCRSCNTSVNSKREYWEGIFTNLIMLECGGDCYV